LPKAAARLLSLLTRLKIGTLTVHAPDGNNQVFGTHEAPFAALHIHRWEMCAEVLKSGDIGFAEGYMAGDWTRPIWPPCCA
jgi:cyclopropane-fatty-acyl-phospholipid synthase